MGKKVTVTRVRQEIVDQFKINGCSLKGVLEIKHRDNIKQSGSIIGEMSEKQIAYCYYGLAEIEPEPVEPWEALKAIYEGKTVEVINKQGKSDILRLDTRVITFDCLRPTWVDEKGEKFYILEEDKYE